MIEKFREELPERALECSECKKPIVVRYTEIIEDTLVETSMCADCPELARRLYGMRSSVHSAGQLTAVAGLCCGNCGTSWESVKTGNPLGCPDCYDVFGDLLVGEMIAANRISPRIAANKKSIPIYIGRAPGEKHEINPSLRLLALNEALKETLSREDYEQAAWLRDQIRALTESEKPEEGRGFDEGRK